MVARKLLLLLLFALQTWTPGEALECASSENDAKNCISDKFCHIKYNYIRNHVIMLCEPYRNYSGTLEDDDMNEICEEMEVRLQEDYRYRHIMQETGLPCFSSTAQADIIFCCGKTECSNKYFLAHEIMGQYRRAEGGMPTIDFIRWQTTSTTTTPTTTTTTPTTTTPTTTTTTPTTTPTTIPTTTTSPPTTTTSPTTTTTSPTTTMTSPTTSTTTPTPTPTTTTETKPTTTTISPSTAAPSTSTARSIASTASRTASSGTTIKCYEVDHLNNNLTTSNRECSSGDQCCLIAVASNDSYASGCVNSSGMAKVNEMLNSTIEYFTLCQRLFESAPRCAKHSSGIRCERHESRNDGNFNICCTAEKENTVEAVHIYEEEATNCEESNVRSPATMESKNAEKSESSSLLVPLVVVAVIVLLLITLAIAVILIRRKKMKSMKKKIRKKDKNRDKQQRTSNVLTKNTVDTRPLPADNTTMGLVKSSLDDFSTTTANTDMTPMMNWNKPSATSGKRTSKMTRTSTPSDETTRGHTVDEMNATTTTSTNNSVSRKPSVRIGKSLDRNSSKAPIFQTTQKNSVRASNERAKSRGKKSSESKMKQKSKETQKSRLSADGKRSKEKPAKKYQSKETPLTLTPKTARGGSRQQAEEAETFKI